MGSELHQRAQVDADNIYHPGLPNDRLVFGLRGTMSEAELQVMHARLLGGARHKAARGELRRQMPMGYVWRADEEKPRIDPDEAVAGAIRTVVQSFSEKGSIRQAWLWLRSENLDFPQRVPGTDAIRWVKPTYISIREILINPVYAGAHAYGRSRAERYVDTQGQVQARRRKLPRSQREVFLLDHHEGCIDWDTFQINQTKIGSNMWQDGDDTGGAAREGGALLQGIGRCGNCGRALYVRCGGRNSMAYYLCNGDQVCAGRGKRCLWVSGRMIHDEVIGAFLAALKPGGITASFKAELMIQGHDCCVEQRRLHVEPLRYEALSAERRYRAVDPKTVLWPADSRRIGRAACSSSRTLNVSWGAEVGQALHVTMGNAQTSSIQYVGFGIYFNECTDGTSYTGIKFDIKGTMAGCTMQFGINIRDDAKNTDDAKASCTASSCYGPQASVAAADITSTAKTVSIPYNKVQSGAPEKISATMSPGYTEFMTGILWQFTIPLAAADAGASCVADITLDNVMFY